MAIKRYTPKYKKLNRLRQAFWFEKKGKIKSFKKQKWSGLKRFYYPRKYQFYNQDKSAYSLSKDIEDEKSIRIKKTYKFLLMDKQRVQLFYGGGRLRHYQFKMLVKEALRRSVTTGATPAKAMLSLMENRTQTLLYRLGFVSSLMEARRFIHSGHLEISNQIIKNCSYELKQLDLLRFDPAKIQ
jgi:ribosomal protein S4